MSLHTGRLGIVERDHGDRGCLCPEGSCDGGDEATDHDHAVDLATLDEPYGRSLAGQESPAGPIGLRDRAGSTDDTVLPRRRARCVARVRVAGLGVMAPCGGD